MAWPSARQRSIPPARLATSEKPASRRITVVCAERLPARHTATIGRSRASSSAGSANSPQGIKIALRDLPGKALTQSERHLTLSNARERFGHR